MKTILTALICAVQLLGQKSPCDCGPRQHFLLTPGSAWLGKLPFSFQLEESPGGSFELGLSCPAFDRDGGSLRDFSVRLAATVLPEPEPGTDRSFQIYTWGMRAQRIKEPPLAAAEEEEMAGGVDRTLLLSPDEAARTLVIVEYSSPQACRLYWIPLGLFSPER